MMQRYELKRMIETKDFAMLRDMGTDTLIRLLSSDVKQGIATVNQDNDVHSAEDAAEAGEALDATVLSLNERRRIYGGNETQGSDIRQLLLEAWKPVVSIKFIRNI